MTFFTVGLALVAICIAIRFWQVRKLLLRLQSKIRFIVTEKADRLCWRDIYLDLAKELPENPQVDHTPPTPVFLANCEHFERCMRQGSPYEASDCPLRMEGCPGRIVSKNS